MAEAGVAPGEPEIDYVELDRLLTDEFGLEKENLIMVLQGVQRELGFLPEAALRYVALKLDLPLSHVYSVATFYTTFSLVPKGRHIVSVCLGTACHVRGAQRVFKRLSDILEVEPGGTTPDMRFTLETVRCVGCCSLGPVVRIGEETYVRVAQNRLPDILDNHP